MGDADQDVSDSNRDCLAEEALLPEIDRLELDYLLADLEQLQRRIEMLDEGSPQRYEVSEDAMLLATVPGVAAFTATSLACRVGRVERFPRATA